MRTVLAIGVLVLLTGCSNEPSNSGASGGSANSSTSGGSGGTAGSSASGGSGATAGSSASGGAAAGGASAGGSSAGGAGGGLAGSAGSSATGHLIFDDEFNGAASSAPDPSKWKVLGGSAPPRWGEECFVNNRAHISLDGTGHLVETATYNPGGVPCNNGSGPYESGGMTTGSATNGLFDFQYGTVEARIKVPCQSGTGMWPAWWSDGPGWPKGGEIDYLEVMKGGLGYDAHQTLHGATTSGGHWNLGYKNTSTTLWCKQYHVYGAIWTHGKLQFTIDGAVTHTATPSDMHSGWIWPFDSSHERLLVDLEVGGAGGTVNNATLPQSMLVDWVRVYQ